MGVRTPTLKTVLTIPSALAAEVRKTRELIRLCPGVLTHRRAQELRRVQTLRPLTIFLKSAGILLTLDLDLPGPVAGSANELGFVCSSSILTAISPS